MEYKVQFTKKVFLFNYKFKVVNLQEKVIPVKYENKQYIYNLFP